MCKTKEIKLIILFSIISIIIFISIFFIQLKIYNQKKYNDSLVLKKPNISSIKNTYKENIAKASICSNSKNNWRIKISKINLDAPILEGTDSEVLRKGVGHFKSTGISDGNICLAAHNRGYKYNFFQNIKDLSLEDEIIYTTEQFEMKFKVVENKIIKETDISVIENSNENKLTLITCEENKREYRRCIIAKQIL